MNLIKCNLGKDAKSISQSLMILLIIWSWYLYSSRKNYWILDIHGNLSSLDAKLDQYADINEPKIDISYALINAPRLVIHEVIIETPKIMIEISPRITWE